MLCLSIRQPWPWFIFREDPWKKTIENRKWPAPREMWGSNILIHAARALTEKEFDEACAFAAKCGARVFPQFQDLKRGGIVGMVRLVRCVRISDSPWFVGKFGFVFDRPYPLPFRPYDGKLGFFDVL